MKNLTMLLATLALVTSASFAAAHTVAVVPAAKDDCKKQSETDKDGCAPAVVLGGLNDVGIVIGVGALALVALAGGSSGSHSGSH